LTVFDIRREAAERFAAEMRSVVKGRIVIADSPAQAASAGDAVICVTQSKDKLVKQEWLKPERSCSNGSYQECEDEVILRADKISVDHVGQCLHRGALRESNEAGKIDEKNIYATIGEVVAGKKPGRTSATERIVCIPIGTAALDVAVATIAYRRALEKGFGGRYAFA
jgi:alanine dehydrogenase